MLGLDLNIMSLKISVRRWIDAPKCWPSSLTPVASQRELFIEELIYVTCTVVLDCTERVSWPEGLGDPCADLSVCRCHVYRDPLGLNWTMATMRLDHLWKPQAKVVLCLQHRRSMIMIFGFRYAFQVSSSSDVWLQLVNRLSSYFRPRCGTIMCC